MDTAITRGHVRAVRTRRLQNEPDQSLSNSREGRFRSVSVGGVSRRSTRVHARRVRRTPALCPVTREKVGHARIAMNLFEARATTQHELTLVVHDHAVVTVRRRRQAHAGVGVVQSTARTVPVCPSFLFVVHGTSVDEPEDVLVTRRVVHPRDRISFEAETSRVFNSYRRVRREGQRKPTSIPPAVAANAKAGEGHRRRSRHSDEVRRRTTRKHPQEEQNAESRHLCTWVSECVVIPWRRTG